jgi:phosphoglycolate phosphatase
VINPPLSPFYKGGSNHHASVSPSFFKEEDDNEECFSPSFVKGGPGRISLIIYDLDGTLVDSAPDIATAVNRMRRELGHADKTLDAIKQWVGNGSAMLVKRSLGDALGIAPEQVATDVFEHAYALFYKHYRLTNGQHTTVFPGVRDALDHFRERGVAQAVCTNKPGEFTEALLAALDLTRYFRCIASGDSLPVKKPDPAPLLYCAEQCQVPIQECLMVGDSMTDVKAARAASMHVACVNYGYHRGDSLASADAQVASLAELSALLATR